MTAFILNLSTRLRLVVSFTYWILYPGERAHGTHWRGAWVEPRVSLDAVVIKP
jgi:hypothetical protein